MKKNYPFGILLVFSILLFANSCEKEKRVPVVITKDVSSITATEAVTGGTITSDNGLSITQKGVCWGTTNDPTLSNNFTSDGSGVDDYSSVVSGLSPLTTYYVRAYAQNSDGTGYGITKSFKTRGVYDIEGNLYNTIIIGSQEWMTQNLRTTKFNDNTSIPLVTNGTTWSGLTSSGYCWYNNDETTYKSTHGALYNWYAVSTGKLCPDGWHVPTDAEWTILTDYLGGISVAGGKLKQTGTLNWLSPNTGATNEVGFTALGSGFRFYLDGSYTHILGDTYFWSATPDATNTAWRRAINYNSTVIARSTSTNPHGFSVRCVKTN